MPRRRGIQGFTVVFGVVFGFAFFGVTILFGGACESVVDPIRVGQDCPEQPLRGPDKWSGEPSGLLIDDFEDGDERVAPVANRTGSWILGADRSSGDIVAETSDRCSARGGKAGHFAGSGFTDWGANWTAVFRDQTGMALPYDGRAYGGISFWAAVGTDAEPPFDVPFGLTTVDVAWNGGVCSAKCMDFYRTVVPLTRSWQRVLIRFDALAQEGWGDMQLPMRRDQLVGFIIWPTHQFEIWIDDVRFEP